MGGDIRWTDRLAWPYARWREHLDRPGVETWVAYDRGTPAGYVELEAQQEGVVEILYFGLLPAFRAAASAGTCCRTAWRAAGTWRTGGRG